MRKIIFVVLLSLVGGSLYAQNQAQMNHKSFNRSVADSAIDIQKNISATYSLKKAVLLPVSLITAGVVVESLPSNTVFSKNRIQIQIQDRLNGFRTTADNYLQFVPMGLLFGFKLGGMKSRDDLLNQTLLAAKSELLMLTIVNSMKYLIHDMRPDGSANNSMPSGHTAQAFASAALLDMEYRDTSPWISFGGYLCATATGFFRVANNRHWTPDVLIGAGIGIASVKVVYLTHRYKWRNQSSHQAILIPTLYSSGAGVSFAMKF